MSTEGAGVVDFELGPWRPSDKAFALEPRSEGRHDDRRASFGKASVSRIYACFR